MPKIFTSEKQKIGELGEEIATKFLMKHNFSIIDRNYTKKWGEIDIIAEKERKLFFIEVKSKTSNNLDDINGKKNVSCETIDNYRPEENMHPWKLKRLSRTIQTYILSKKIKDEVEWQVDLIVVYMDINNKKARLKVVKNIIL